MNNVNKIVMAVALLCSGASATALAQAVDYNPSWYIAPSLNVIDPDNRFGLDNRGQGLGLRFGKPLSEFWDIQMGTTYARARQTPDRYQQNTLGADGLLMLSRGAFRPFLLIGAGAERDKTNSILGETRKTSPYVNAGIGAQVALNDQWALQADIRRVHGLLGNNSAFGFSRSNNNYLTIGLNYSFDKPPAPAPVVTPPPPAPEPVVEPKVAPPAPTPPPPAPRFEKYTLSSTEMFGFDSAILNTPQPKLDQIATALKSDPSVTNVAITGYADRLGSKKYNMTLSEKRANAVKDYLIGKGIDSGRLSATGKGEANPVVECSNKKRADLIKCLEPNRRVEVEQITIERRVQ